MELCFSYFISIVLVITYSSAKGHSSTIRCPIGTFGCAESETCVEQRYICDGKTDCPSGSDEWKCENEHHYQQWNNMFKKRPDADSETTTGRCSLDMPVQKCSCSQTKVFCGNSDFLQVPTGLPFSASHLDLSSNHLGAVSSTGFTNLTTLETLSLANNRIRYIAFGAFRPLTNLRSLYLTGNKLSYIGEDLLETNTKLQLLDLSYNVISRLIPGAFSHLSSLTELDLRSNSLSTIPRDAFKGLSQLQILHLSNNRLSCLSPGMFTSLTQLHSMYLTRNEINRIKNYTFQETISLKGLYLSVNSLAELQTGSLDNLTLLLNLDLSENFLNTFERGVFDTLKNLRSLDLRKNLVRKLPEDLLKCLTSLEFVYFDEFAMCAHALHVRVCEPKSDGISSLENLLDSVVLRLSVWLVAVLACAGNALVLVGRHVIREHNNEVHSMYIKNLSLADFLMGLYLLVIASYDVYFRGDYIRHDFRWRHSWQCNFCGFLSTLSSEASVFTLTIITFDRYASITSPLTVPRRTKRHAATCVAALWLVAGVLALLPVLPGISYYGSEFYGNNGVCLPLHMHDPYAQAWEYSAAMFVGVNFVAFAFIVFAYWRMFSVIRQSTLALRSTQEKQDRTIAKRFAFIVGTDFICWMPVIVFKVLALTGTTKIHPNLYAWLAVFVLPVNSALNPILYTLTTKIFKQQVCHWMCNLKELRSSKKRSVAGVKSQEISSALSLSYVLFHRPSWYKRNHHQQQPTTPASGGTASTMARSSVKSSSSSKESTKRLRITGPDQFLLAPCTSV